MEPRRRPVARMCQGGVLYPSPVPKSRTWAILSRFSLGGLRSTAYPFLSLVW
jgi:hypothetical protein